MTTKINANLLIDQECKYKGAIIYDKNGLYTCTLNQTDIKSNKNKFYIMQVLQNGKEFVHYIRYGRIGERGTITYNSYPDGQTATGFFEKQFKSKTGNSWASRGVFKHKAGKYFMSVISYDDELEKLDDDEEEETEAKPPVSTLDPRLQDLLERLSNQKMMANALIKLDIDPKKMPLGKINKTQLDKGQKILQQLSDLIDEQNADDDDIADLSSQFYTLIPYSCGRKIPPAINNTELLAKYLEMLDELRNIEIAVQITKVKDKTLHPIDTIYKGMGNEIIPLDKSGQMWKAIEKYVKNTQASTHHCDLDIIDIFEVRRNGEKERFEKDIGNHQLLFHGSGLANWISILSTGLRMPQTLGKGIYISGAMFSSGIYSANAISKSFGYCRVENNDQANENVACLLLNEVALGTQAERTQADYDITKESLEAEGCHSTWGKGETTPSSFETIDNVIIPNGKLRKSKGKSDLLYDEFIVYDVNQVLQRYVLLVKNKA